MWSFRFHSSLVNNRKTSKFRCGSKSVSYSIYKKPMPNPLQLIVLVFYLAFCGMCVKGETIVVSMKGDDQNSGSRDHPLRTISAAAEKAMPGDTVFVLEGTYRERVTPMKMRAAVFTLVSPKMNCLTIAVQNMLMVTTPLKSN